VGKRPSGNRRSLDVLAGSGPDAASIRPRDGVDAPSVRMGLPTLRVVAGQPGRQQHRPLVPTSSRPERNGWIPAPWVETSRSPSSPGSLRAETPGARKEIPVGRVRLRRRRSGRKRSGRTRSGRTRSGRTRSGRTRSYLASAPLRPRSDHDPATARINRWSAGGCANTKRLVDCANRPGSPGMFWRPCWVCSMVGIDDTLPSPFARMAGVSRCP
jgi:hypothetical protein